MVWSYPYEEYRCGSRHNQKAWTIFHLSWSLVVVEFLEGRYSVLGSLYRTLLYLFFHLKQSRESLFSLLVLFGGDFDWARVSSWTRWVSLSIVSELTVERSRRSAGLLSTVFLGESPIGAIVESLVILFWFCFPSICFSVNGCISILLTGLAMPQCWPIWPSRLTWPPVWLFWGCISCRSVGECMKLTDDLRIFSVFPLRKAAASTCLSIYEEFSVLTGLCGRLTLLALLVLWLNKFPELLIVPSESVSGELRLLKPSPSLLALLTLKRLDGSVRWDQSKLASV